jgi:hypothetical protein
LHAARDHFSSGDVILPAREARPSACSSARSRNADGALTGRDSSDLAICSSENAVVAQCPPNVNEF